MPCTDPGINTNDFHRTGKPYKCKFEEKILQHFHVSRDYYSDRKGTIRILH